ncbi:tolloid-like protein 2 [Oculina patagonica]
MAVEGLLLILATLLSLPGVVAGNCPTSLFTSPEGTISSPGFNTTQSYGDNLACTYNIMVPANRRVILEFKKLDVLGTLPDCAEDSLEIRVGCIDDAIGKFWTSIGKFCSCSDLSMPNKIYSVDNCMTLIFKSDGSKRGTGFEAQYTSMDNNTKLDPSSNCSTMFLSSSNGTFFTPNWPLKYLACASCSWTFYPSQGKIVRLFFTSFEMEGQFECEPFRHWLTGDEIRINGTNSTGGQQDIVPRQCSKVDFPYYTIKQMQAITARFKSNERTEDSGAIAGYATYKKGTLESQSPGCQAIQVPESTTKPSTTVAAATAKPSTTAAPSGKKTIAIVLGVVCGVVAIAIVVFIVVRYCKKTTFVEVPTKDLKDPQDVELME